MESWIDGLGGGHGIYAALWQNPPEGASGPSHWNELAGVQQASSHGHLPRQDPCRYNPCVRYSWDEAKRITNLRKHGLDFADTSEVFAGPTCTIEDSRLAYGEKRFLSYGLLRGMVVSIVHTETEHEIRVISFRKATSRETAFFFENL